MAGARVCRIVGSGRPLEACTMPSGVSQGSGRIDKAGNGTLAAVRGCSVGNYCEMRRQTNGEGTRADNDLFWGTACCGHKKQHRD